MKHNLMLKAYIWLITTLRDYGPITLKEINRLWKEDKIDDGNELDRFKFYRYKREIEEAFSLFINYDPNEGYSISNPNIFRKGSIENWMLSTMAVNYAIGNCADIKGRIGVENIPSSEHFLKDIIQAMRKTHELQITYQAYGAENATTYIVQPYFLKLYHQRWYVIGPSDIRPIITLALDRIQKVKDTHLEFLMDTTLTVDDYLKDCYGVMRDETLEAEDILIRAYGFEVNVLRDLPLHRSLKEVKIGDGWSDFSLRLRPSWDFIGKLMERGSRIKVLEPASVVAKIWAKHAESVKLYEDSKDFSEV